jgi:predicted MFS family arabinose efflux permease
MVQEVFVKSELSPSGQSQRSLSGLIFCISDIRHGIGPLLSIHLRNSLHWDPAKIGLALAAIEFSAFLSQIPAGLLIDSSKRKRSIIAFSALLIIIGCLIILLNTSLSWIISAQLLMGIAVALILPTLGSITLGLFGRKKFASRLGRNELWNHLGNVFTALTAGLIAYKFGSFAIFFLLIGFAIGSLIFLSFIKPREINYEVSRELPTEANTSAIPVKDLFKRKSIIIFNISLILYYLANGAQMSLVAQMLAIRDPKNGALLIAACMIIAELTMVIVAYVMSKVVNRFNRKTLFLTAFIILPVRALLYVIVENSYLLLLIQTLDGVAAGILGIMGTLINSDLAINTGRFNLIQAFGGMSNSIGESLSLVSAGLFASIFGFNTSFLFLVAVGILGTAFFSIFMPETKPTEVKI